MKTLEIEGQRPLAGAIVAPPDKSISHRALMFAALGAGSTEIAPLSAGGDNRTTLALLRALGVRIEIAPGENTATVFGVEHPKNFLPLKGPLDCENSGTTIRILSGILVASGHRYILTGDESLQGRPMSRLKALEKMGAEISGVERGGKIYPPILLGGARLKGADHVLEVASAQLKSALLLAGLWAEGRTRVREPARSRDHTERMLRALGVPVVSAGPRDWIEVETLEKPWRSERIEVAPDFSSAAFLIALALITRSAELVVETAVNPTRTGFLDAVRALGADLQVDPLPDRGGEPMARISVRPGPLQGALIEGEVCLRALDEIPVLAVVAAFAQGTTEIRDIHELRVKESDRIRSTATLLRAFGSEVEEQEAGLVISGGKPLHAAEVDAGLDHRIGLCAAVLGLSVPGRTRLHGAEIIDVSYPTFASEVRRLGGEIFGAADLPR